MVLPLTDHDTKAVQVSLWRFRPVSITQLPTRTKQKSLEYWLPRFINYRSVSGEVLGSRADKTATQGGLRDSSTLVI